MLIANPGDRAKGVRRVRVIVLLLCLAALVACNQRFAADFEADTPGAPPPLQPPGPPDDEIVLIDGQANGNGTVIRVTDEPDLVAPGAPARFMSLINETDPGLSSSASLRTSAMATSTQSIFLSWEQVLDGGGSGQVTIFAFPPPPQDELASCRVLTGNDRIDVECSANKGPTVGETLTGMDTQAQHTLTIRIGRPDGPVAVQVVQGGEVAAATLATPTPPRPAEGDELHAVVSYEGQSDGAYRFNSVGISERDPN
jgi:hypothetical protein